MLVEAAIGDAYGCPFEYAPASFVDENNDGETYRDHPSSATRGNGRYTDDAQMGMCVQEMMVDDAEWTKLSCATYFLRGFKRDERSGYSLGLYSLLRETKSPDELVKRLGDAQSEKSGAAMRAFPIGAYPTIDQVLHVAASQAALTHNSHAGITAAQASAMMTHYFYYQLGSKDDLGTWLTRHISSIPGAGRWDEPYVGPVGAKGWMSVKAAITAVQSLDSLTEILRRCIAFSGDVDTVATIALAASSLSVEVDNDLSAQLYDSLEDGAYGRGYMSWLDTELSARLPPHRLG